MMIGESALMHHDLTKAVKVELAFITNQLQSMVARTRYVQHNSAPLKINSHTKAPISCDLFPVERSEKDRTRQATSSIRKTS